MIKVQGDMQPLEVSVDGISYKVVVVCDGNGSRFFSTVKGTTVEFRGHEDSLRGFPEAVSEDVLVQKIATAIDAYFM